MLFNKSLWTGRYPSLLNLNHSFGCVGFSRVFSLILGLILLGSVGGSSVGRAWHNVHTEQFACESGDLRIHGIQKVVYEVKPAAKNFSGTLILGNNRVIEGPVERQILEKSSAGQSEAVRAMARVLEIPESWKKVTQVVIFEMKAKDMGGSFGNVNAVGVNYLDGLGAIVAKAMMLTSAGPLKCDR